MPGSPAEPDAGTAPGPTGDRSRGLVTIARADYLWFVDRALAEMTDILRALGDDLANRRPALDGANSAFVILTQCLGVMEYWGGRQVAHPETKGAVLLHILEELYQHLGQMELTRDVLRARLAD